MRTCTGCRRPGCASSPCTGPGAGRTWPRICSADAIVRGRPITLNNRGDMERDFTYIDDIVAGVLAALDRPPAGEGGAPHAIYNLGNHRPVQLRRFSRSSRRRSGARPRSSWRRCRRATWCAPAPTSRLAGALSASNPRRRSRRACRGSSRGTASTTGSGEPANNQEVDRGSPCDIRPGEIVAFKQQGLAGDLGQRVGEDVAEIQASGVTASAEAAEGLAGELGLLER